MTSKQSIIIDTDLGPDDALAILLALGHDEAFDLVGITAVCGNVGVETAAANALKVLGLAGREDVPVFQGARSPLVSKLVTAAALHGQSIAEGWDLAASKVVPRPDFAVDWIIDIVSSCPPGTITICALGPLTNVAMAIAKCPHVATRLGGIVMMAGSTQGGNMNAVAEFNVFVDAHAAAAVFSAPVAKTVVSLDVTSKLLVTGSELERLAVANSAIATEVRKLLRLYERYAKEGAPRPLHDPAVIAWLLVPAMFQGKRVDVEIDTAVGPTHGQTIVAPNGTASGCKGTLWLTDVDKTAFYDLLECTLSRSYDPCRRHRDGRAEA